jgi:hypothetical protein
LPLFDALRRRDDRLWLAVADKIVGSLMSTAATRMPSRRPHPPVFSGRGYQGQGTAAA